MALKRRSKPPIMDLHDFDGWEAGIMDSGSGKRSQQDCSSADLDPLLRELYFRHWAFYYFPNAHAPTVIAAVRCHEVPVADVVALFGDFCLAYRAPVLRKSEPF